MSQTKKLAFCGIMAALCIVLLLLGSVLGLGIYAAPMFAGIFLIPIGYECGRRYQLITWVAVSLLSFLLVPEPEETLLFACLLGWYPALHPSLKRLPKALRIVVKAVIFNGIVILLELLIMQVLVPGGELYGKWLLLVLLLLANVVFIVYDMLIPRFVLLYEHRLRGKLNIFR